jgi:formylglycine-generating enzyme required for sulfatase activity
LADVFISYKREDRAPAERLATALRLEGFTVWWDDRLTPEKPFDELIESEISQASVVLVLWSPIAVGSSWVRSEAHYGNDRGRYVPVWIEMCELPLAFRLKQTIDLSHWTGEREDRNWHKLIGWLTDLKAGTDAAEPVVGIDPSKFREIHGRLPNGDPVFDGSTISIRTPPGTAFCDGPALPVMIVLPAGRFMLGAAPGDPDARPTEGPRKQVDIAAPFAMGVFPVLVREFARPRIDPLPEAPARRGWFGRKTIRAKEAAAGDPSLRAGLPVTSVCLREAEAFAAELTRITGALYRLPSETEWEYACRAGSTTRFNWGNEASPDLAHFAALPGAPPAGPTAPGQFRPNEFGLYDMHGNVREWTLDLWHDDYGDTPADGAPARGGHSSMHVVRGGCYADPAPVIRASVRGRAGTEDRLAMIGFRLVRQLG